MELYIHVLVWYKYSGQWSLSQKAVWYMLNDVLIWKQFSLVQESSSCNQPLQLALTYPTVSFFRAVSGSSMNIKIKCILPFEGALVTGQLSGIVYWIDKIEAILLCLFRNPNQLWSAAVVCVCLRSLRTWKTKPLWKCEVHSVNKFLSVSSLPFSFVFLR